MLGRVLVGLIVAVSTILGYVIALALSFALGRLGVLLGATIVVLCPAMGLRLGRPFVGSTRISRRALLTCVLGATFAGLLAWPLLGLSLVEGDAISSTGTIAVATSISIGAMVGALWSPRTNAGGPTNGWS